MKDKDFGNQYDEATSEKFRKATYESLGIEIVKSGMHFDGSKSERIPSEQNPDLMSVHFATNTEELEIDGRKITKDDIQIINERIGTLNKNLEQEGHGKNLISAVINENDDKGSLTIDVEIGNFDQFLKEPFEVMEHLQNSKSYEHKKTLEQDHKEVPPKAIKERSSTKQERGFVIEGIVSEQQTQKSDRIMKVGEFTEQSSQELKQLLQENLGFEINGAVASMSEGKLIGRDGEIIKRAEDRELENIKFSTDISNISVDGQPLQDMAKINERLEKINSKLDGKISIDNDGKHFNIKVDNPDKTFEHLNSLDTAEVSKESIQEKVTSPQEKEIKFEQEQLNSNKSLISPELSKELFAMVAESEIARAGGYKDKKLEARKAVQDISAKIEESLINNHNMDNLEAKATSDDLFADAVVKATHDPNVKEAKQAAKAGQSTSIKKESTTIPDGVEDIMAMERQKISTNSMEVENKEKPESLWNKILNKIEKALEPDTKPKHIPNREGFVLTNGKVIKPDANPLDGRGWTKGRVHSLAHNSGELEGALGIEKNTHHHVLRGSGKYNELVDDQYQKLKETYNADKIEQMPDGFDKQIAEKKLLQIEHAYSVLSDSDKRHEYIGKPSEHNNFIKESNKEIKSLERERDQKLGSLAKENSLEELKGSKHEKLTKGDDVKLPHAMTAQVSNSSKSPRIS